MKRKREKGEGQAKVRKTEEQPEINSALSKVATKTEEEIPAEEKDRVHDPIIGSFSLRYKLTEKTNAVKTKCLVCASRGITPKHRHLMLDMRSLLPHHRYHNKLSAKANLCEAMKEVCSHHHCDTLMYFEARKRQNLYMWLGHAPDGPSFKFQIHN
eukprot:gene900-1851_t